MPADLALTLGSFITLTPVTRSPHSYHTLITLLSHSCLRSHSTCYIHTRHQQTLTLSWMSSKVSRGRSCWQLRLGQRTCRWVWCCVVCFRRCGNECDCVYACGCETKGSDKQVNVNRVTVLAVPLALWTPNGCCPCVVSHAVSCCVLRALPCVLLIPPPPNK